MDELFDKYAYDVVMSPIKKLNKKNYVTVPRTAKWQRCALKYRMTSPYQKDYSTLRQIAKDLNLSYGQVLRNFKRETTNHPELVIFTIAPVGKAKSL